MKNRTTEDPEVIDEAAIQIQRDEHSAPRSLWGIIKHLFMWKDNPKDRL